MSSPTKPETSQNRLSGKLMIIGARLPISDQSKPQEDHSEQSNAIPIA